LADEKLLLKIVLLSLGTSGNTAACPADYIGVSVAARYFIGDAEAWQPNVFRFDNSDCLVKPGYFKSA